MDAIMLACLCGSESPAGPEYQISCPRHLEVSKSLRALLQQSPMTVGGLLLVVTALHQRLQSYVVALANESSENQGPERTLASTLDAVAKALENELDEYRTHLKETIENSAEDRALSDEERLLVHHSTGQDRSMTKRFNILEGKRGPMIDDDEFGYDASIRVGGDFATPDEKEAYLKAMCQVLNENETRIPFRPRRTTLE